jgi:hypothetical protein
MKAKLFILLYISLLSVLLVSSCKKDAVEPEVQFTADLSDISNKKVTFSVTGTADGFSVYPGDTGHEFEKSYIAITEGKEIEKEVVYLTTARFNDLKATTIVSDLAILDSIATLIDIRYTGKSAPEFKITLFYDYEVAAAKIAEIMAYFTIENVPYAPTGGFATGIALDAGSKAKVYQHTYGASGTYQATLVATSVGHKKYDGDSQTGLTTGSDYDKKYVIKTITITVP